MNIIADLDVPKDVRTSAEISPNSVGSAILGANDRPSLAVAGPVRLRFDRYVLDLERGCILAGNEEIALRPKTFEFLRYLVSNPGRLVSKDELLTAVWPNVIVSDDSLVQCVTELRRALQDHDQRLIKTVQRRGYRFEAALSVEPPTAVPRAADAPARSATNDPPPPTRHDPRKTGRARHAMLLGAIGTFAVLTATVGTGWWWFNVSNPFTAPPPFSVVVLPFNNVSDDADQDYFAAGLTIDLTTDLSRLPGAFVISPATAQTFNGKSVDARQVGRDLNVRYLLEGSVRQSGNQIRINVQLIDSGTGAHLWAERFELERDHLPAWQNDIVGRIATALNYRLTRLESERTFRERRDYPDAHDLTTRGWALVYREKTSRNYDAARALFKQALERDPQAVNAMAGIGWVSGVSVLSGWSAAPSEDVSAAEAAVVQLLAIDPNHVVGHHVRGFLLRLQRRPEAARDAFRTVVALDANFAPGYAQLGVTELELGRPEEAISSLEHAIRLSPRDPNLGHWLGFIGMAELHQGRHAEAASWLARSIQIDMDPGTPTALQHAYFVSALALAGRPAEARVALADFRRAKPSATIARVRAAALSTEAAFVSQQEYLYEGLRIAGLPE
jgi:TolB-like protein/DNA-binding winged helix-turn-helix (wHTH) protein/predicted TPR repeat methyltransferase